jgi:hypothetical protein
MSDYLFVYGTLQPGVAPREIADAVEELKVIGNATVRGVLYDLGEFPGAVLNPESNIPFMGWSCSCRPNRAFLPSSTITRNSFQPHPRRASLSAFQQ